MGHNRTGRLAVGKRLKNGHNTSKQSKTAVLCPKISRLADNTVLFHKGYLFDTVTKAIFVHVFISLISIFAKLGKHVVIVINFWKMRVFGCGHVFCGLASNNRSTASTSTENLTTPTTTFGSTNRLYRVPSLPRNRGNNKSGIPVAAIHRNLAQATLATGCHFEHSSFVN